jgi:hypothetical protein
MNWEVPELESFAKPSETLRDAYEREVRALAHEVDRLRAEGSTNEVIARSVHAARRAIGSYSAGVGAFGVIDVSWCGVSR